MRKQFLSEKCTLLFLTTLILCLTACSSLPFSATASTPTSKPTPHIPKHVLETLDSCSLVTKAQIEQIIKAQITTVQEPNKINEQHYDINMCSYSTQSIPEDVSIDLNVDQDAVSAKNNFSSFITRDSAMNPKSIDGLGDQAFVEPIPFPIVDVLEDNARLSVSIAHKMDVTELENEEIQIARIALQSL